MARKRTKTEIAKAGNGHTANLEVGVGRADHLASVRGGIAQADDVLTPVRAQISDGRRLKYLKKAAGTGWLHIVS
jgi:hypothetical protein